MQAASADKPTASAAAQAEDTGSDAAAVPGGMRARIQTLVGPDSRLRQRFMAWWDGYYLPEEPKPEKPDQPAATDSNAQLEADAKAVAAGGLPDKWSVARVKVSTIANCDPAAPFKTKAKTEKGEAPPKATRTPANAIAARMANAG